MLNENRFLDTFRGHSKRAIMLTTLKFTGSCSLVINKDFVRNVVYPRQTLHEKVQTHMGKKRSMTAASIWFYIFSITSVLIDFIDYIHCLGSTCNKGEFICPGYDCSNVLNQNKNAKDGFYWIHLNDTTPKKVSNCYKLLVAARGYRLQVAG